MYPCKKNYIKDCDGCFCCKEQEKENICPECGSEYDTLYMKDGKIIGCDQCITEVC